MECVSNVRVEPSSRHMSSALSAFEVKRLRQILRVSWTEKRTNCKNSETKNLSQRSADHVQFLQYALSNLAVVIIPLKLMDADQHQI